jgi:hypothetical protein
MPVLWDHGEAEVLLAGIQSDVERVKTQFGDSLPTVLGNVLEDAVAIARDYVRGHEKEAARGWDAMELLRGLRRSVGQWVANYFHRLGKGEIS